MANPEHLEILNQGIEVWNTWRDLLPEIEPDLREAILQDRDLSEMDLGGVDLTGAYLYSASLVGANMRKAILELADLRDARCYAANLEGASLQKANLHEADLSGVILRDAHLVEASLEYATFDNTNVSGCDFSNATMLGTKFLNTDLSKAKGLDLIHHNGPSSIDIDTLYSSGGKIPESFLRGCGVPDSLIIQIPLLIGAIEPFQFYSCFISYSSKDQEFAERLYVDLQNKGVRCWYAPEDLKIGDKIRDRIDESIRLRDKLLLILSESSITSDWVEHEVESALEEEKQRGHTILFPIRLDNAVMESSKAWAALIRRTRHIGDFTCWKDHGSYQKAFDRLLRDLKAEETNKPTFNATQDDLYQSAVLSPQQTLIGEWDKVEASIVQAAKRNGLTKEGELVDCSRIINQLSEMGKISRDAREEFFSLSKIHNNVTFSGSSSVEPGMAIHFAKRARELQKAFEIE